MTLVPTICRWRIRCLPFIKALNFKWKEQLKYILGRLMYMSRDSFKTDVEKYPPLTLRGAFSMSVAACLSSYRFFVLYVHVNTQFTQCKCPQTLCVQMHACKHSNTHLLWYDTINQVLNKCALSCGEDRQQVGSEWARRGHQPVPLALLLNKGLSSHGACICGCL